MACNNPPSGQCQVNVRIIIELFRWQGLQCSEPDVFLPSGHRSCNLGIGLVRLKWQFELHGFGLYPALVPYAQCDRVGVWTVRARRGLDKITRSAARQSLAHAPTGQDNANGETKDKFPFTLPFWQARFDVTNLVT